MVEWWHNFLFEHGSALREFLYTVLAVALGVCLGLAAFTLGLLIVAAIWAW